MWWNFPENPLYVQILQFVFLFTGDTLIVGATICNSSSKKMKPKVSLCQKTVYRAQGSTNTSDNILCIMEGETLAPNSEETVSCHMTIPNDVTHSIHNCAIISVEHYMKVCNNVMLHQVRTAFGPNMWSMQTSPWQILTYILLMSQADPFSNLF